jgi:hypothetical protein
LTQIWLAQSPGPLQNEPVPPLELEDAALDAEEAAEELEDAALEADEEAPDAADALAADVLDAAFEAEVVLDSEDELDRLLEDEAADVTPTPDVDVLVAPPLPPVPGPKRPVSCNPHPASTRLTRPTSPSPRARRMNTAGLILGPMGEWSHERPRLG